MKISGLSNQWKSRDGLYRRFAQIDPLSDLSCLPEWARKFSLLIQRLEDLTGPDLFIGTSHVCMNFNTRDAESEYDRVSPFAFVEILDDGKTDELYYRIKKRRIQKERPTDDWIVERTTLPKVAAAQIRTAADYADVPVRRRKNRAE